MRIFHIDGSSVLETDSLPAQLAPRGYVWVACSRSEFEAELPALQGMLQLLCGSPLLDLHVSDLLNAQLPSHHDYTSRYDLLVFRRLASAEGDAAPAQPPAPDTRRQRKGGPPVLRRIDTSPVGFAVFDRVLLSVHPAGCQALAQYASRLLAAPGSQTRSAGPHLPQQPADLMLRIVNQIVDGYLDLRRELSRQLDHWQTELLQPRTRFTNWSALLEARIALHQLDDVCEDQRTAVLDWIEGLAGWQPDDDTGGQRGLELLRVRSRDVLEHIERVVHHVRRLEQNAETAVQMHFSAQSHRTNDIMRTLTALTAIFLPLNLIAGIFGMNFEFIPLIHLETGFWWALAAMVVVTVVLVAVFWRKRYLARSAGR
jgi:magnesium transporter